ncbi:hypothetical protein E7744_13330 [Citricoccus sp. SGAir0253]|uniref:hypothetical protein n=1 Tax=Citricoccus sp. SGAir0253 TaxID=2567881 RepID=UPI0010CCBB66|nr:hypothetical protein [Citricoccus sp. SGAir0253]QCU79006.1 hypothetical protein E7744_13330 [Citricoccus sp. SGAir0253]
MSDNHVIAIAITAIFCPAALWCGVLSARAYRGSWRGWTAIHPPLTLWGPHWGLLTLAVYSGTSLIGGVLLGLAQAGDSSWMQVASIAVLLTGIVVGMVVSHVLPDRWRPEWYRRQPVGASTGRR